MEKLQTIFFDVGNTLLFPNRERMLAPLHARGIFPTSEQMQARERHTKLEFDKLEQDGRVDHGFWHIFYSGLLAELGIKDEALLAALVNTVRISANWCEIRPGTREVLQQLGSRYETAVISNADGKIAVVLQKCGIADCFRTITDSGIVGHEKPHPAIFAAALQSMNARADESLYVGDVYSVDYVGATQAGMKACLFDVCGAYREIGLPRVESLQELAEKFGAETVAR
jgi:HAD superfamily hydrolase (TIGR01509 family)